MPSIITRYAATLLAVLAITASPCGWAQSDAALAASAKEAGAVVTKSGLVYRSLKDGAGSSPLAADKVKVHYKGTFPDGKEFDSSCTSSPRSKVIN